MQGFVLGEEAVNELAATGTSVADISAAPAVNPSGTPTCPAYGERRSRKYSRFDDV